MRRGGLATCLITAAERYAIAKGCTNAFFETFSFQTQPFYEKLGYKVFGTLDGYPEGHRQFYLSKRMRRSSPRGC